MITSERLCEIRNYVACYGGEMWRDLLEAYDELRSKIEVLSFEGTGTDIYYDGPNVVVNECENDQEPPYHGWAITISHWDDKNLEGLIENDARYRVSVELLSPASDDIEEE